MNTGPLSFKQAQALNEIKQRVFLRFSVVDCLLYGSAVGERRMKNRTLTF
jgi:hypothetical protein